MRKLKVTRYTLQATELSNTVAGMEVMRQDLSEALPDDCIFN